MKDQPIINRVANSALVTIDLEDFYLPGPRVGIDLAKWLLEGIVFREKDFRKAVNSQDWQKYQGAYVYLFCSTDAILPGWAYMFVSLQLGDFAKKVVVGDEFTLENTLFTEAVQNFDASIYQDKPVIIKGCAKREIPPNAYVLLAQKLQAYAKSIMYGEACSAVPMFKRKK